MHQSGRNVCQWELLQDTEFKRITSSKNSQVTKEQLSEVKEKELKEDRPDMIPKKTHT